jgi:hypothetical protein
MERRRTNRTMVADRYTKQRRPQPRVGMRSRHQHRRALQSSFAQIRERLICLR